MFRVPIAPSAEELTPSQPLPSRHQYECTGPLLPLRRTAWLAIREPRSLGPGRFAGRERRVDQAGRRAAPE